MIPFPSEPLGNLENGFLYILSDLEALKMDFYTFRVARKGEKCIIIQFCLRFLFFAPYFFIFISNLSSLL